MNMQKQKVDTYIGFAVKARDVIFGLDNIVTAKKKIRVIVTDDSLGEASRRKLRNYLNKNDIPCYILDHSLGEVLRRDNCKILGVTNDSLAGAICNELQGKEFVGQE